MLKTWKFGEPLTTFKSISSCSPHQLHFVELDFEELKEIVRYWRSEYLSCERMKSLSGLLSLHGSDHPCIRKKLWGNVYENGIATITSSSVPDKPKFALI
jgi:hypothetical protein